MGRKVTAVVGAVLLLCLGLAMSAPFWVEFWLAKGMEKAWGGRVKVYLEEWSINDLQQGRLARARLTGSQVRLGQLEIGQLDARIEGGEFDVFGFRETGKLNFVGMKRAQVTLSISQEDLARYMIQNVKNVKQANVSVRGGRVFVEGLYQAGGFVPVQVSLEGRILVEENKVKYVTEKFKIINSPLGNIAGDALLRIVLLETDRLPFDAVMTEVVPGEGCIIIRAEKS